MVPTVSAILWALVDDPGHPRGGYFGAELCLVVAGCGFFVQAVMILISPVVRLVHLAETESYPTRS
jgi:hypothetical protein